MRALSVVGVAGSVRKPSRTTSLVAAVLDGSFAMRSHDAIRADIRQRVRDLGNGEALVGEKGRFGERLSDNTVQLPALLLFEEPPGYAAAREEYERKRAEWKAESDALDAAISAMRLKVQIGSDKALEALVEQADTLCSMSLTASNRLLIGGPK